jgi:leader peptidase (prepilin peptidase)/N-methyltransferase
MLIEVGTGIALAGLYWWEVARLGLLVIPLPSGPPACAFINDHIQAIAHAQFAAHVLLFALMLVASFIDIDERIIPDTITLPGTLAGLMLAAISPWSFLTGNSWLPPGGNASYEFLHINSPNCWPEGLAASPQMVSLVIGLGCWWAWCFAIMPRRWLTRRGLGVALRVLFARLQREPLTWWLTVLGVVGSAAIFAVWQFAAPVTWAGLATGLIGMAAGGGMVWLIRVLGSYALGKEAMGFGDVTLMAMVGAFVGWQPAMLTFFLAPFAGLLIGAGQWMLHRENEIPYGPFLCLGASFVIVAWASIWESMEIYFSTPWLVPGIVSVCLILTGVLLGFWRMVSARLMGRGE